MERFYIITNRSKDKNNEVTMQIKGYLEEKGKTCILCMKDDEGNLIPGTVPENIDCALVLGGDGTLIRAARQLREYRIPLLGINLGTLGYLTEVELQNMQTAIDQMVSEEPVVEERMMLKGVMPNGQEGIALNDIVVARQSALRIIHFNIYVNGELLNDYQADGVIISTPTGSTGYNLSAGGPIVEPKASMIVITPICSHALNTRSIILSDEDEVVIEIAEGKNSGVENALITFDGSDMTELKTGDQVVIRKAEEQTRFLKLSKISFLEILRRKMKGN